MPPKQPKMISYILAKFEMAKKSIWKCEKMITKWQFFANRFFCHFKFWHNRRNGFWIWSLYSFCPIAKAYTMSWGLTETILLLTLTLHSVVKNTFFIVFRKILTYSSICIFFKQCYSSSTCCLGSLFDLNKLLITNLNLSLLRISYIILLSAIDLSR